MVVPTLVGYGVGVNAFGDVQEAYTLQKHRRQYEREMKDYKRELYYS